MIPRRPKHLFHLLATMAVVLAFSGTAMADHSLGNSCYTCHNLKSANVLAGTYAISNLKATQSTFLSGGTANEPLWCDYCHTYWQTDFTKPTVRSAHPIRTIAKEAPAGANILCDDCHDYVSGGVEDLTPGSRNLAGRSDATDGYPNHNNVDGYANGFQSGHFTYGYNATSFALCFDCHGTGDNGGDSSGTNSAVDIQVVYNSAVNKGAGHNYPGAGSKGAGWKMPCYDCHYAHDKTPGNNALIIDQVNNDWPTVSTPAVWGTVDLPVAMVYDTAGVDRNLCLRCHVSGATVEGANPVVPIWTAGATHAGFNTLITQQCLSDNGGCHLSPHDVTAGGTSAWSAIGPAARSWPSTS